MQRLFPVREEAAAPRLEPEEARAPEGWQPGAIFEAGQTWQDYKEQLLADLCMSADVGRARTMIEAQIAAAPERDRPHMEAHLVRHLQTFALMPGGPGRLLDIGGPSLYAPPLADLKDWQIDTVEILAIDYERDSLPVSDASMDAVAICEVIEHFTFDPLFCFAEINRVLRPGGALLVTTPNACSWFVVYQALRQMSPNRWPVYAAPDASNRENHIHAREYLTGDLAALLSAVGFEVETMLTRDYGISAAYVPIPGFSETDRGDTIFCLARKSAAPRLRSVRPVYTEDRPWPGSV